MPSQRWRLIFSRGADAPDLTQREHLSAWDTALETAGLREPGNPASRFVLAAPIPAGLTADRELADLFLPDRRTVAHLRARVGPTVPLGHQLVALHDVWTGEPPLPGQVVAADYRVDIDVDGESPMPDADTLRRAVAAFLEAKTIERRRTRGDRPVAGNLRDLVADIRQSAGRGLWMRLRFDPALGTGRPEEVVDALGVIAGCGLIAARRHRERLWLKGDDVAAPAFTDVATPVDGRRA